MLLFESRGLSSQGSFRLDVEEGSFTDSEILVMLGENGTGKTTFIRMLAGMLPPDDEERTEVPEFNVSYKPQKISPKFTSTVCTFSCFCRHDCDLTYTHRHSASVACDQVMVLPCAALVAN